jgi:hypothetical protein
MYLLILSFMSLFCFSLSSSAEIANEELDLEDASSLVLPPPKMPSYDHSRDPNETKSWSELVSKAAAEIAKKTAEIAIAEAQRELIKAQADAKAKAEAGEKDKEKAVSEDDELLRLYKEYEKSADERSVSPLTFDSWKNLIKTANDKNRNVEDIVNEARVEKEREEKKRKKEEHRERLQKELKDEEAQKLQEIKDQEKKRDEWKKEQDRMRRENEEKKLKQEEEDQKKRDEWQKLLQPK